MRHPVQRFRFRRMEARIRRRRAEHRAQRELNDNARIRSEYEDHPVRLMGVVVGDLFLSDEFDRLQRHLAGALPAQTSGDDYLEMFFRKAGRTTLPSRHWASIRHLSRQRRGFGPVQHYPDLPDDVDYALVQLYQPSAGVVLLATFLELSQRGQESVAEVMTAHHAGRVERTRRGEREWPVTTRKREVLSERLAPLANLRIFPAGLGLLRDQRYPGGVVCIYGGAPLPPVAPSGWGSLPFILGVDDLEHFSATDGDALLRGVPSAAERFEEQGFSLFMGDAAWGRYESEYANSVGGVHLEYEVSIQAILTWTILVDSMQIIAADAATLRRYMEGYRYTALPRLRRHFLYGRVDELDRLNYRLQRLRAFRRDFESEPLPPMRYVSPSISAAQSSSEAPPASAEIRSSFLDRLRRIRWRPASGQQLAAVVEARSGSDDLRIALSRLSTSLIASAIADTRTSTLRARHLLQMRTNSTMRWWAVITAAFTLVAAFAAIVAVVVAAHH